MNPLKFLRQYAGLLILLGIIFAIDWIMPYEVNVGSLYLIAVGYATWRFGPKVGLATAFVCAGLWIWGDYGTGHRYPQIWMLWVNGMVRLLTNLVALFAVALYLRMLEAHRRRLVTLERVLSVCPGCGCINVNADGWQKASDFYHKSSQRYTLCPSCAAAHKTDATTDPSHLPHH
ncbi:MAG TPA: hypothetical protein VMC06_03640 [Opitutaceae bacterium]|nr:hypothetical protein [Opitutaceae bacterium]